MGIYIKRVDQVITKIIKPINVNIDISDVGTQNVIDPNNGWRWDVGLDGDFSFLQMICIYVDNIRSLPDFILNSIPVIPYSTFVPAQPIMLPIDFEYKTSDGKSELLLEAFADFKSVDNRPYPLWVETASGNEYYIDGDYDRICDGLYEVDLEPTLINFSRSL